MRAQGLACENKRAAANIEHRQQTMLVALERTLAEVTRNSETVQARVSELTAQQGQMESQAEEIASRCGQLCAHEEALRSDIAAVTDQKHQARLLIDVPDRLRKIVCCRHVLGMSSAGAPCVGWHVSK